MELNLAGIVSLVIYVALGLIAMWGTFCVVMVTRRVAQIRFRSEAEQIKFLDELDPLIEARDFNGATNMCDGDERAMPQLASMAVASRELGYVKVRTMLADRFQRDVLSDLEYRLSWIYAVIKAAPMVGLLGTVIGMMGAFAKIAGGDKVDPTQLADDISFALITTACGLAIAIPLVLATTSINVKIRKMEDLVSAGTTRFLETFKAALGKTAAGKE